MDFLKKQSTATNPVLRIVVLALLIVLPIFGFAIGTEYQNIVSIEEKQLTQGGDPSTVPTQTITPNNIDNSNKLANTTEWNIHKIKVYFDPSKYMFAPGHYESEFKFPKTWKVTEDVDQNGCGTYTVTDTNRNMLTLERDCSYERTTYYKIPDDLVVIKRYKQFGDGGSPFIVFRFLANNNREYSYGGKFVGTDKLFTSNVPLYAFDLKAYAVISSDDSADETLKLMDSIVASLSIAQKISE